MRISDWSSDVCSSDLQEQRVEVVGAPRAQARGGVNLDFRLPVGVCTDHRGRIREPGGINPVGAAMAARRTVGWVERSETHRPACNHAARNDGFRFALRSEEHTSELQSLMRNSYAVFCLKKKKKKKK